MQNRRTGNGVSHCVEKVISQSRIACVIFFAVLCASMPVLPAYALQNGLDTPSGVSTLQLSVQGVTGCTLTANPVDATLPPSLGCGGAFNENGKLSVTVNNPTDWAATFTNSSGAANTYGVFSNGIIQSYISAANNNWSGIFQNMAGPYGIYTSNSQNIYSTLANGGYGLYTNGTIQIQGTLNINGNQMWNGNGALYLNYSAPAGSVSIGGGGTQQNLYVAMGDVDVPNGGIQIGNTSNCTPGMIRWDGTQWWGCNASTSWTQFGSSHPSHTEDVSTTTNNQNSPGNTVTSNSTHDLCVLSHLYRVHDSGNGYMTNCTVSGNPGGQWQLNVYGVAEQVNCTMSCYDF